MLQQTIRNCDNKLCTRRRALDRTRLAQPWARVQLWDACTWARAASGACAALGMCAPRRSSLGVSTHMDAMPRARMHQGMDDPATYGMAARLWAHATLSVCMILGVFMSLSVCNFWCMEDPRCWLVLSSACARGPARGTGLYHLPV